MAVKKEAPDIDHIRNLVFQGGGVRGIAYVGALQVLESVGVTKHIRRVCGSSAGAVTAALFALYEGDVAKIKTVQQDTDFSRFADDPGGPIGGIVRLWRRFGWHKGDAFSRWIEGQVLSSRGVRHISFADLKKRSGIDVVLTGFNYTRGRTILMSSETTPDLYVDRAVRISMSIPLYFAGVFIDGNNFAPDTGAIIGNPENKRVHGRRRGLVVDGGTVDRYPIRVFDLPPYADHPLDGEIIVDSEDRSGRFNKSTLGFRLSPLPDDGVPIVDGKIGDKNVAAYAMGLVSILHSYANDRHLDPEDWHRTIRIEPDPPISRIDFSLDRAQQNSLIRNGVTATERYLSDYSTEWRNHPRYRT